MAPAICSSWTVPGLIASLTSTEYLTCSTATTRNPWLPHVCAGKRRAMAVMPWPTGSRPNEAGRRRSDARGSASFRRRLRIEPPLHWFGFRLRRRDQWRTSAPDGSDRGFVDNASTRRAIITARSCRRIVRKAHHKLFRSIAGRFGGGQRLLQGPTGLPFLSQKVVMLVRCLFRGVGSSLRFLKAQIQRLDIGTKADRSFALALQRVDRLILREFGVTDFGLQVTRRRLHVRQCPFGSLPCGGFGG